MLKEMQVMEAWLMMLQRKEKTTRDVCMIFWIRNLWSRQMEPMNQPWLASTIKVEPLFWWDNQCWFSGAETLAVITKRPASLRWIFCEYFLRVGTQKLWSKDVTNVTSEAGCWRWYWFWRQEGVMENSGGLALGRRVIGPEEKSGEAIGKSDAVGTLAYQRQQCHGMTSLSLRGVPEKQSCPDPLELRRSCVRPTCQALNFLHCLILVLLLFGCDCYLVLPFWNMKVSNWVWVL